MTATSHTPEPPLGSLKAQLRRALRALQLTRAVLGPYRGERSKKKRIAIATADYVLGQHGLLSDEQEATQHRRYEP